MADKIKVDLAVMQTVADKTASLQSSFSTGAPNSYDGGDSVSHAGLVNALTEVHTSWSDNRDKIGRKLEEIAKGAKTIIDTLTETDQSLSDGLSDAEEDAS